MKRLLQAASIVGRLFSTSALAAISGTPPSADLLREAARRDLVVEADENAPGAGRVHRFKHPLFREVAYGTIPKADRLRMHDGYGRWLEATLGERAEEVREIVAYHAEQAYLFAKELGRVSASELGARALALLIAAADRARLRSDLHAAWKLYERAATVAEATGAEARIRAHARGFALLGRLEFAPADADTERALAETLVLARGAGPSEILVRLLNWLALDAFNRKADTDLAKRIAAELPDLARATGDPDLVAFALGQCGLLSYWWNDREAEARFYLAALDAGRQGVRPSSVSFPLRWLHRRAQRYSGDYAAAARYESEFVRTVGAGTSLLARLVTESRAGASRRWQRPSSPPPTVTRKALSESSATRSSGSGRAGTASTSRCCACHSVNC